MPYIPPKRSKGEFIALGSALLMFIGFMALAWQFEFTGREILAVVDELSWGDATNLPFGAPLLYLIPFAASISSLAALWGLFFPVGRGAAAILTLIVGIASFVYFGSYFANQGNLGLVGAGFWLAMIGAAGLIIQVFFPRETPSTPNQVSQTADLIAKVEGLPIATVLAVLYVAFIFSAQNVFLQPRIYTSFMQTISPQIVIALGLTFVITAGEIDLSFPAVVALSGFAFVWCYREIGGDFGPWIGLVAAMLVGAVIGYVNGILVARIGVPSIMATLAAQFFWYGVTILVADGKSIALTEIRDEPIYEIFTGRIQGILPDQRGVPVGIPSQAVWALGLMIFMWFLLNRHKFGESVMFIGDNPDVARVMGINVEATRIQLFTLMGVISGFAGVLLTLDINVFFPNQAEGYLLPVMAAVFIGGTSFAGGIGAITGTFFGAYIIGSLEAGVVASGISGYWVPLVKGLVMGASVVLNVLLGEGQMAALTAQLQHWGIPIGTRHGDFDKPKHEPEPLPDEV